MISEDSDKIAIIAFLLSKIESITKQFESVTKQFENVTKELVAEQEKPRILKDRLNVLYNAHQYGHAIK